MVLDCLRQAQGKNTQHSSTRHPYPAACFRGLLQSACRSCHEPSNTRRSSPRSDMRSRSLHARQSRAGASPQSPAACVRPLSQVPSGGHSSAAAGVSQALRPESSPSSVHLLQLNVAHNHIHPVARSQMFGHLLRQVHRAVLAPCAPKRDHKALEAALLIAAHACIHTRLDGCKKLLHARLVIQVLDHRRVLAGQLSELFFAPGIGKTARIENKSATVSRFITGCLAVEAETEN